MFPYAMDEDGALGYAATVNAEVAAARGQGRWTLSPRSWLASDKTTRVVLPSINGARLCARADAAVVIAGCLRNARAVAEYAQQIGEQIAVIPAGERWPDGSLRPCLEDWLGAGAILSYMQGSASPEAQAAIDLFKSSVDELHERIARCSSGRELVGAGYAEDVRLATELNASECVPVLREGRFCNCP